MDGETVAITQVALQAGETAAEVDAVEEQVEELEQQVEVFEMRQKWTDQLIDDLFNRVNEMEMRLDEIEALEAIEEENNPGVHDELETSQETVLAKTEEFATQEETKKNKPARGLW